MSDTSITVDYSITSITNSNGTSTIVWTLSHAGTSLSEPRTGDKFKTADLAQGIQSTDSDYDRATKVQANFENIAAPYFKAFAVRVRAAQDSTFANYLDDQTGDVEGLSIGVAQNFKGSVTVTG